MDDIVRPAWRHAERSRNACAHAPMKSRRCVTIVNGPKVTFVAPHVGNSVSAAGYMLERLVDPALLDGREPVSDNATGADNQQERPEGDALESFLGQAPSWHGNRFGSFAADEIATFRRTTSRRGARAADSIRNPQRLYASHPSRDEDIVRSSRRRGEAGRNDRPLRRESGSNNQSEIPCRVSSDPHEWRNDLGAVSTKDSAKLKYP
jgi:hypothetical protein